MVKKKKILTHKNRKFLRKSFKNISRGLETIVVDYMRPKVVGPALAKLGVAVVYGISVFTLGGLFYFNYSDVGIVNAIKMFWKL